MAEAAASGAAPALPGSWRASRIAIAAGVVATIGMGVILFARPRPRAAPDADANREGGALLFDGHGGARTDQPVTNQLDNIAYDVMVRYDGRHEGTAPQVIIYNGHTGTSGWGAIVAPPGSALPDGTVQVLAGGVVIRTTPLVLRKGVWQHLVLERRSWHVTVKLDDLSYDAGNVIVNEIGTSRQGVERTSVGANFASSDSAQEAFHGAIARAGIRDLSSGYWIARWYFEEGQGPTATGEHGNVLTIVNGTWLGGPRR